MTELVPTFLLVVMVVYHAWYVWESNKQTKRLIKGILSKDAIEYAQAEVMEDKPNKPQEEPEYLNLADISDEQFEELIDKQVKR